MTTKLLTLQGDYTTVETLTRLIRRLHTVVGEFSWMVEGEFKRVLRVRL